MAAITITVVDGNVTIDYETKTSANIKQRFEQLQKQLGINMYGVCVLFGMEATENNVRLLRRYYRDPDKASYREMPENQWKLLLALVEGQPPA